MKKLLTLFSITFFIGIWQGFPILDIIGDEMYFVGGVLRAMSAGTIFPLLGDVQYGMITYYLNYLLMIPFLGVMYSITDNARQFLTENPHYAYLVLRVLSAIAGLGFLRIFYLFIKKEIKDNKMKVFLIVMMFSNMLFTMILHTGKVWVISTLLAYASFYYLYKAITRGKNIDAFISILLAFLALANFQMMGVFLINIPILLYYFRGKTIKYSIISFVIFAAVVLSNFQNVISFTNVTFTHYMVIEQYTVIGSLALNFKKIFMFYPLFLILLPFGKIRNKKLFWLSVAYSLTYFIGISLIGRWSTTDYSYTRFLFPLAPFIMMIVVSLDIKFRKVFYLIGAVSMVYFLFTIYYMSVPTTYNVARNYVINVPNLQLPKNKKSYLNIQSKFCSSKCREIIENDLNKDFLPLIIDEYSINKVEGDYQIDVIGSGYMVDNRMANYFDLKFFTAKRFGEEITIKL